MLSYIGSHGTTRQRADNIRSIGFRIRHDRSRYSSGVYFWKQSYHFINLAIGWYRHCKKNDIYKRDKDSRCAVVIADLVANEEEVLDLENDVYKDTLAKLAEERGIHGDDWKAISSLVESLIQIVQIDLKVKYKIVLKKAMPPHLDCCPEYPYSILGWADCCIVKDVSCIEIQEIRNELT